MALNYGDAALDSDIWFRIVTSESHISRGRIKHGAFKGHFFGKARPDRQALYHTEISGRLRSQAGSIGDIEKHGISYCAARQNLNFSGLMYCRNPELSQLFKAFDQNAQIYFTPITAGPNTDLAHSDIGISGKAIDVKDEQHEKLLIALSDMFTALHHPDQIKLLPSPAIDGTAPSISQEAVRPSFLARVLNALACIAERIGFHRRR